LLFGTVSPARLFLGRARPRGVSRYRAAMPPGRVGRRPCRPLDGERGKRPGGARRTLGSGAGAPSAVAAGAWRRTRSSRGSHDPPRRAGKPSTRAKGSSEYAARLDGRRSPVNTGAPLPGLDEAQERVLHFQRKLHEWASNDAERRFCDLWNLVCDPATLVVAWSRVSRNRGSQDELEGHLDNAVAERRIGVARRVEAGLEDRLQERFLRELRGELKAGEFRPLPVRERLIPKARRSPSARDSVPARPAGAGRDRRDRPVHEGPLELRVGHRDGHRGVLSTASHTASSVMRSGGGSGTSACWRSSGRS
jgi:hypothetical protein